MKRALAFLALLVLSAVSAGCGSLKGMQFLSGGAEAWRAELAGDVQFNVAGFTGTRIDVVDDLGMERRDDSIVYRATAGTPSLFIEGRYIDLDYRGDAILGQTVTFAGQTFTVNTNVKSDLDITLVSLLGKFALFQLPFVAVGGVAGVDFFDLRASIESTTPVTLKATEKIEAPIPVLGLCAVAEVPLPGGLGVFAEAEVSGLFFDHEEIDGTYINASARGGVNLDGWLNLGGGYRYLNVDFERDPKYDASVKVEGPFLFAEIAF